MLTWRIKKLRGKYNPTIKKKKRPNLQWVKLPSGERVKACTKCIKALVKKTDSKKKVKSQAPTETVVPKTEENK
jgi:hypothetical protein